MKPKAQEKKPRAEELRGKVLWAKPEALSIEYGQSSESTYEKILSITSETKMEGISGPAALKAGDAVRVYYEQREEENKEQGRMIRQSVATHVTLVEAIR